MNTDSIRRVTPFVVAIMLFLLARARPDQRGVWIALGVIFLLIGLRRLRARGTNTKPPETPPETR